MIRISTVLVTLALLCGVGGAQSLTLSPAVVPLGGKPGQSTTQHLTLLNRTHQRLAFELVAKDVVVTGGMREFVAAGDLPASIAATAVFSKKTVTLDPGLEGSVDVTLTLPPHASTRAVVVLFQGTTKVRDQATVSLGSLITFELAGRSSVKLGDITATAATASRNAVVSVPLDNDGDEPIIVRGAYAVVAASGAFVGKVALKPNRLLPGEHDVLEADYPGELGAGTYRIIATLESGSRSWTRSSELTVP
jgi:hypothetical protein